MSARKRNFKVEDFFGILFGVIYGLALISILIGAVIAAPYFITHW